MVGFNDFIRLTTCVSGTFIYSGIKHDNIGVNHIQCISRSSGLISIIASEFCGNGIFSFYTFCKCNNAIIVY